MSGRVASRIALVPVVMALLLSTGCSPPGTTSAKQKVQKPPSPLRVSATENLNGLRVTIETTLVADPGSAEKVRLVVVAHALNSTDETMTMVLEHNFPDLLGADGRGIRSFGDMLSATHASGKFSPGGQALGPGGELVTHQYYLVAPGQKGLRLVWEVGPEGTPKVDVPLEAGRK